MHELEHRCSSLHMLDHLGHTHTHTHSNIQHDVTPDDATQYDAACLLEQLVMHYTRQGNTDAHAHGLSVLSSFSSKLWLHASSLQRSYSPTPLNARGPLRGQCSVFIGISESRVTHRRNHLQDWEPLEAWKLVGGHPKTCFP